MLKTISYLIALFGLLSTVSAFEYPTATEKLTFDFPLYKGKSTFHAASYKWTGNSIAKTLILPENKFAVNNVPEQNLNSFTIDLYAKPFDGCNGYAVLKKGSFGIAFRKDGIISVYFPDKDGKEKSYQLPKKYESSNTVNCALSSDGSSLTIYCNGEKVKTLPFNSEMLSNNSPLFIGNSDGWGEEFKGEISGFRIFSKAFNEDDIKRNYTDFSSTKELPAITENIVYEINPGKNDRFSKNMLQFDGQKDYIELKDIKPSQYPSISIFAFVQPRFQEKEEVLLEFRNCFKILINKEKMLECYLTTSEGEYKASGKIDASSESPIWIGMSWNGKFLQVFAAGKPIGMLTKTKGSFKIPSSKSLFIGSSAEKTAFFCGNIGDVRISSETFSDTAGNTESISLDNSNHDRFERDRSRHLAGLQEQMQPILNFENIEGWKLTYYKDIIFAKMHRTAEEPLWGDYTARIVIKKGTYHNDDLNKVVITPPEPVVIEQPFDAISLWIMPQYTGKRSNLMLSFQIQDSAGIIHDIPMKTADYAWFHWSGWTIWNKPLTKTISTPAKLMSMTFSALNLQQQELYFDSVYFYKRNQRPLPDAKVPSWESIGIPISENTILPKLEAQEIRAANEVRTHDNEYVFSYEKNGDILVFKYIPETGTLSDFTAIKNNKTFIPMYEGGWKFIDNEKPNRVELVSSELKDGVLNVKWSYSLKNTKTISSWTIRMKGKSLIVDMQADKGVISELSLGKIKGLSNPKIVEVPYMALSGWRHRSVDPGILNSGDLFVSCLLDWYNSDASELFGERDDVLTTKSEIDRVTGNLKWIEEKNNIANKQEAIINGGAAYYKKTDGAFNPPKERIFLSVSEKFSEVLPEIPNPSYSYPKQTNDRLWSTRAWYLDKYPYPNYFQEESAMWTKLQAYGVDKVNVRFHGNLHRMYTPRRNGDPITFIKDIDPGIGGDAGLRKLFESMQNSGYRVGLYTDHTLLSPLSYETWSEDYLTLSSVGEWTYGSDGHLQVKNSRMLELQKKYNKIFRDKFNPDCAYLDQLTCPPPWRYTDYDSRVPEAGKFNAAYRAFAESLKQELKDFNGPVLSEGLMQWMYSGLCESYAQPTRPDQPTLPDFQLKKLHMKSNDTGFHLKYVERWEPELVNRLLAAEIAYGNSGHLYGIYHGAPPREIPHHLLKSYFMIQQLQKFYVNIPVEGIKYDVNGKLQAVEDAIKADSLSNNRIYLKYQNGLEVFVNRNKTEQWKITFEGKEYILPPEGWLASIKDNIFTFSALFENRRVDFMKGKDYIYCSAGGRAFDFGIIKALNTYVLRVLPSETILMPAPFQSEEKIEIDTGSLLCLKNCNEVYINSLNEHDEVLEKSIVPVTDKKIKVDISKNVFKYVIKANSERN